LQAEYFAAEPRSGAPTFTGFDTEITTEQLLTRWYGAPPATFSAQWFGYLTVLRSGRYTLALTSDDAGFLSVDGRRVLENAGRHEASTVTVDLTLARGPHVVLVEYAQYGGAFAVDWRLAATGSPPEHPPAWALTPYKPRVWTIVAARAVDLLALAFLAGAMGWLVVAAWRHRTAIERQMRWVALAIFAVLAVIHTWPLATDITHLIRHDNRDTMLNEWIVSWVAHQAPRDPVHLFDGNIFHPERRTLAFSEPLIPQAAIGAPFLWLGGSTVLAYNVILLTGFALTGWSMCLVLRSWTGCWTAGLVAGAIFAFNAHVLTRIPHLQAQHVEFLPAALWALDALLRQPTVRRGLQLAAWASLQALASVHLLVFTVFGLAGALLVRPKEWWGRRATIRSLAATAVASGIVLLPFLLPYFQVNRELGLTRSLGDAAMYAGTWKDYLSTPARLHYRLWSHHFFVGTALFPGALGLLLAALAIARGGLRDGRARMCMAVGIVGLLLSFGPTLPGYATLFQILPLLRAIRGTARFGYLVTVAVAALAGFGVLTLKRSVSARTWPPIAGLLVTIASFESFAGPLGLVRSYGIPPIYSRVPRQPGIHVVEIPFHGPRSAQFHAAYMLNSTAHWQPIVNGYSGFQPPSFYRHAEILQSFPNGDALALLRTLAVTHVFVHITEVAPETMAAIDGTPWLEVVDRFGSIVLYRVNPGAR
jgi:hypothetical protein